MIGISAQSKETTRILEQQRKGRSGFRPTENFCDALILYIKQIHIRGHHEEGAVLHAEIGINECCVLGIQTSMGTAWPLLGYVQIKGASFPFSSRRSYPEAFSRIIGWTLNGILLAIECVKYPSWDRASESVDPGWHV